VGGDSVGVKVIVGVGGTGVGVYVSVGAGVFEANKAPISRLAPVNQMIRNAAPRIMSRAAPMNNTVVCLD
jgi:hypothetical protein